MPYFMVLNDGETYTEVNNCAIVFVDHQDADPFQLDQVIKEAVANPKGSAKSQDGLFWAYRILRLNK